MVIVLKDSADKKQIEELMEWLTRFDVKSNLVEGVHSKIIGLIGDTTAVDIESVQAKEIVDTVKRVQEPYKNANRRFHPLDTVIDVRGRKLGLQVRCEI